MKKQFDRPKFSNAGKPFGNRFSSGKPSSTTGRFRAVCGQCGSACEVPFKPSSSRPVLCNNCFRKDSDFEPNFSQRGEGKKRFGNDRNTFSDKPQQDPIQKQLSIINTKLDKILDLLEELEFESDDE